LSFVVSIAAALLLAAASFAQSESRPDSPLVTGFMNPPASTKPWTYWYWATDNVSREGITRDLEAMARVGIGEALVGIVDLPEIPRGKVKVLSAEWWGLVEHAIREGGRLGVDIGMFNGPGWSLSGGPWVKPEQSMRYVKLDRAWTESRPRGHRAMQAIEGAFDLVSDELFTACAIEVQVKEPFDAACTLLAEGETVTTFSIDREAPSGAANVGPMRRGPVIVAFPAHASKRFRFVLKDLRGRAPDSVLLHPSPRLERFVEKQLGVTSLDSQPAWGSYQWKPQPELEGREGILDPLEVRGIIPVSLPTGATNLPCAPEARGLECNKMSRAAVKAHFDAYVGKLLGRMPAAERRALKHVVVDSWEAGPQNWTDGFGETFKSRYGYDPLPWLPTLEGWIVGSAERSDRFLWDLRRLVADRIASEYAGGMRDACREAGLELLLQNYGHWGFPAEFLQYGAPADRICGELWAEGDLGKIEVRAAASCGHVYGKQVVSVESFTGGPMFRSTPASLKRRGDWALSEGANHFILHLFFHQPTEDRPGINARWGTELNRHNTWFAQMGPWLDSLRSSCFLLQQGRHVADVAIFIGEDTPVMTGPDVGMPRGYDFDWVNADVILNRMKVEDGRFVLPDGKSYRLLVLPPLARMRPEVLTKIAMLVEGGGAVLGRPPERSPSLQGWPACDAAVKELATKVWAGVENATGRGRFGRGRVFMAIDVDNALAQLGVTPDVDGLAPEVRFIHRSGDGADVWFLSNQGDEPVSFMPSFRIAGMQPEIWDPVRRTITRVAVFEASIHDTRVPMALEPGGSVFVVFRHRLGPEPAVWEARLDGRVVASTKPRPATLVPVGALEARSNDFTIEVRATPEASIDLPAEADSGVFKTVRRNDALFPLHGGILFAGPGHASAGLSIGTNGVVVWEHGDDYFAPVLVHPATVAPWTHVTVVYEGGRPFLYLEGTLVRGGRQSKRAVHPSPSADARDPAISKILANARLEAGAPFTGRLSEVVRYGRALLPQEVAELAQAAPATAGDLPVCALAASGRAFEAEVSTAGRFELSLTDQTKRRFEVRSLARPLLLEGPWEVWFPADPQSPKPTTFASLRSWPDHPDPAVRHFSGTATYAKAFDAPPELFGMRHRIRLDLGRVGALAQVVVNGHDLGVLWSAPYVVDATRVLRPGPNAIEVRVTNAWLNRLIGAKRFSDRFKPVVACNVDDLLGDDLAPSGLMGPVRLVPTQRVLVR
jgi:hypothetical protein